MATRQRATVATLACMIPASHANLDSDRVSAWSTDTHRIQADSRIYLSDMNSPGVRGAVRDLGGGSPTGSQLDLVEAQV